MRRIARALTAAFVALATSLPTGAETPAIQDNASLQITPRSNNEIDAILPGLTEDRSRRFVQLMWMEQENRLRRVSFHLDDPLAEFDLDLAWQPKAPFDLGAQALGHWGDGRLVWRKKGARPYDHLAVLATYEGRITDGKFDGQGRYWHDSGLVYEGGWSKGKLEGQGIIHWPDGDSYSGSFEHSLPHGHGRLVTRYGGVFVGNYSKGQRHGTGRVTLPDGRSYHSVWLEGREALEQRQWEFPTQHLQLAQAANQPGIRFGVSVDRRVPPELSANLYAGYDSRSDGNGLIVYPMDQSFMDRWRGRAELVSEAVDLFDTDTMHHPANFVMSLENSGPQPVQIVAGFLAVQSSTPDLDPFINLRTPIDCGNRTEGRVFLRNWGWSSPIGAKIEGGIITRDGTRYLASINSAQILGWPNAEVDFSTTLQQIGPRIASMATSDLICATADYAGCLATAQAQGLIGALSEAAYVKRNAIMVDYFGTLSYAWSDANGQAKQKASQIRFPLKIGQFQQTAECGEGSDAPSAFETAFQLQLDQQGYQVQFPFNVAIAQGQLSSWTFQIDAPASSRHNFQVVLQLSDGRQIASQLIDLTYFKPRSIYRTQ